MPLVFFHNKFEVWQAAEDFPVGGLRWERVTDGESFFFSLSLDRQVLLVHSVLYLRTSHPVLSAPPRKAGTTHAIAQSREASEAFSCEHSRVA